MLVIVGYTKQLRIFRHKKVKMFVPTYEDLGKGKTPDKALNMEIKRET